MGSIRVSEKHGVNPSLMQCFACMEDYGVALMGRLRGDAEAPHRFCTKDSICDKCLEYMKAGVILISVRDGESGDNPYRTGGWCVVKDDLITRAIHPPELAAHILKSRLAFVPDEAWAKLGLPKGGDVATK